jgi:hypothetical protein
VVVILVAICIFACNRARSGTKCIVHEQRPAIAAFLFRTTRSNTCPPSADRPAAPASPPLSRARVPEYTSVFVDHRRPRRTPARKAKPRVKKSKLSTPHARTPRRRLATKRSKVTTPHAKVPRRQLATKRSSSKPPVHNAKPNGNPPAVNDAVDPKGWYCVNPYDVSNPNISLRIASCKQGKAPHPSHSTRYHGHQECYEKCHFAPNK